MKCFLPWGGSFESAGTQAARLQFLTSPIRFLGVMERHEWNGLKGGSFLELQIDNVRDHEDG